MEKKASLWFENTRFTDSKIYFSDLNACFFLDTRPDVDLRDPAHFRHFNSLKETKSLPPGSILQWDAHFGANESRTPRDSLLANPHLELLACFQPDDSILTLGGNVYQIMFFLALPRNQKAYNYAVLDSLIADQEKKYQRRILLVCDFESVTKGMDPLKLSHDTTHQGSGSFRMDRQTKYSPLLEMKCSEISSVKRGIIIRPSAFLFFTDIVKPQQVLFVVSLEENGTSYQYLAESLNQFNIRPDQWTKITLQVQLQTIRSEDDVVKVYLWNAGKKLFYFDDFTVEALIPLAAESK